MNALTRPAWPIRVLARLFDPIIQESNRRHRSISQDQVRQIRRTIMGHS